MRFFTSVSLFLVGMILGVTVAWLTIVPTALENHEASLLQQLWPCGHEKGEVAWVDLPTLGVTIAVDCLLSPELAKHF